MKWLVLTLLCPKWGQKWPQQHKLFNNLCCWGHFWPHFGHRRVNKGLINISTFITSFQYCSHNCMLTIGWGQIWPHFGQPRSWKRFGQRRVKQDILPMENEITNLKDGKSTLPARQRTYEIKLLFQIGRSSPCESIVRWNQTGSTSIRGLGSKSHHTTMKISCH